MKKLENNGKGSTPHDYKGPDLHLFLTKMLKLYGIGMFTLSE